MGNRSLRLYIVNLFVGLAGINLAYLFAYFFAFSGIFGARDAAEGAEYRWMLIICNLLYSAVFTLSSQVRLNELRSFLYFVVLYLGLMIFLQGQEYSRLFHLLFLGGLLTFAVFVKRVDGVGFLERRLFQSHGPVEAVVVGGVYDEHVGRYLRRLPADARIGAFFAANPDGEFETTGELIDNASEDVPVFALDDDFEILTEYVATLHVDEILVMPERLHSNHIERLLSFAEVYHFNVSILPPFAARLESQQFQTDHWHGLPVISMPHSKLALLPYRVAKRMFDVAFSLFFLVVLFPFCALFIAPAIFVCSRGPVFFRQLRKGYRQEPFYLLKFRTMSTGFDDLEAKQATRVDHRVTLVGRLLRKTSLDELPQFFNVLVGKMSIVGPRPHMVEHDDYYDKIISLYNVRFVAKPGITGWAQINGLRGGTETPDLMQRRIEHDLWYIKNWSVLLDLRIIFVTAARMLFGDKNAY